MNDTPATANRTTRKHLSPRLPSAVRLPALLLASTLIITACGGDDPGDGGNGVSLPDGGDSSHGALFDISATADSGESGVDGATSTDVSSTDVTVIDPCAFPKDPASGEPGAPCTSPDSCDNGFCIDTPEGKRCAKTCTDCCPNGWKCEQAPGNDTVFICLPKMGALCRPCTSDAACDKLAAGSLCLAYTDSPAAGSTETGTTRFCGGACAADDDCPAGYACKDADGTKGQGKQCVNTSGTCACTAEFAAAGAEAACTRSTDAGTCSGVRTCAKAGQGISLVACSAKTPAAETCDGQDNDCDGETDEGLAAAPCKVSNSFGTCTGSQTCVAGAESCDAATPVAEVCDGKDNDCDGETDEGCDDDGDGYCATGLAIAGLPEGCTADVAACNKTTNLPAWCPKGVGDCDDSATSGKPVNPGQQETCGNNIDDDCDGVTDAPKAGEEAAGTGPLGCKPHYADVDGDGFGGLKSACLCAPSKSYPATNKADCDDADKLVNPKAKEICANGKDDDCNNSENDVDAKDCVSFYTDVDGDTYGAGTPKCLCAPLGSYKAKQGGDCDDKKSAIHPKAKESCNSVDDNCDGATDEAGAVGCKTWYADSDKDSYGDPKKSACLCGAAAPYLTLQGGDCDDQKYAVSPGFKEICYDSLDNNCNGKTDEEGGKGCVDYWLDLDGDGFGSKKAPKKCLCDKGSVKGYVATKGGDCDDGATGKGIYPGAPEICDGKDNDCDGKTDTGCDVDGDGFCAAGKVVVGKPPVCPKGGGDCNDGNKLIRPGAKEICDGVDNDCKGGVDQGCDDDGDGYCDKNMVVVGKPKVCPKGPGDCDDKNGGRNPSAKEICDNLDNNCKTGVDEGCDDDGDGYCDKGMLVVGKPKICPKGGGDCCDKDKRAYPLASAWHAGANLCGSFDYNCSGTLTKRWTTQAKPDQKCPDLLSCECFANPQGWKDSAPSCGKASSWVTDYVWDGSFTIPLVNSCSKLTTQSKIQECR